MKMEGSKRILVFPHPGGGRGGMERDVIGRIIIVL